MKKFLAVVALASLALALPACEMFGGTKTTGPLVAAANSPIADVPIPAGFYYQQSKSWTQVNPNLKIRSLSHEYKGKDPMLAVAKFYREELPKNKWATPVLEQAGDKITLKTAKSNEDLQIVIWEGTFDTHINVKLEPTGKNVK